MSGTLFRRLEPSFRELMTLTHNSITMDYLKTVYLNTHHQSKLPDVSDPSYVVVLQAILNYTSSKTEDHFKPHIALLLNWPETRVAFTQLREHLRFARSEMAISHRVVHKHDDDEEGSESSSSTQSDSDEDVHAQ